MILTRRWAIKLPGTWTYHPRTWWRGLILGLLANMQERLFAGCGWPELCPVVFSLPGGWLVVMPRLQVLTEEEFEWWLDWREKVKWPPDARMDGSCALPVELKADGWAWRGCSVVAIDYGGGGRGGRARRPGMKEDD